MDSKTLTALCARITPATFKARLAADDAVKGMRGQGTCNLDCAAVSIPGVRGQSQVTAIEEAFGRGGISAHYRGSGSWKGYFLLHPPTGAQGNPRMIQAETIAKVLKEEGFSTTVYYQLD